MAEEKRIETEESKENKKEKEEFVLSETWAEDARVDLEEWIEEQGIYIRQ